MSAQRTLLVSMVLLGGLALAPEVRAQAADQVKNDINAYRTASGLKALATSLPLDRAAQKYAQFLANRDLTTVDPGKDWHNLDGRSPQQRAAAEGYTTGVWENVQMNYGYANPAAEAMKWWKNSPGHNANMLNAGHTVMGVGAAKSASGKWLFVAMFGQSGSITPPPGGPSDRPPPVLARVKVAIENRTGRTVTFQIEGKSYTLAPKARGTYSHTKVGSVQYGFGYKASDGLGGGGGAGILTNRMRYAFVTEGTGLAFRLVGRM